MPATRQQKHEAGRHLVVGEALLRGYDAHTIGPTRLVEVNGHRAAVHVKTKGSWQLGDTDAPRGVRGPDRIAKNRVVETPREVEAGDETRVIGHRATIPCDTVRKAASS